MDAHNFGVSFDDFGGDKIFTRTIGVDDGSNQIAGYFIIIDLTIDYTKERTAFGKPVWSFQNTRFKLAECNSHYIASSALCDAAIESLLKKELTVQHAALIKYWVTEKQCIVMDECVQLFGGYGYMMEYPIARLYADARVQKIYGGTNEIMKELASRFM